MGYNNKDWKRRIAERSDMSSFIVHLTRESHEVNLLQSLFSILSTKKLIGSTTDSGFICGNRRAVCFQDTPLSSLCQNVFYEQKQREINSDYKVRYRPVGLMFEKSFAFSKGARPVIYDKTARAKEYLPEDQWWRIVNFNLDDSNNLIDWTHEREWRCPGDFEFDLSDVTLLVITQKSVQTLAQRFSKELGIDVVSQLNGIVTLRHLLY